MSEAETLSLLEDLIARAKTAGADAADAILMDGISLSVAWRMGALERLERSEGGDIGLRVFVGKRQGIVSSADRSPEALRDLVDRAVAIARTVPEDPFAGLADPDQIGRDLPGLESCDPAEPSAEELTAMARAAEDAARAVPGVTNSEGGEAGWSQTRVALAASNGFSQSYARTGSSLAASVIAGDDVGGMERDYDYTAAVFRADLRDAAEVGRSAGQRAVRRLGARRPRTGRVPVVFDPRVARSLIGHLLGAINGASIARGTSFLKDKMGEQVFAEGIRIIDDPHRHRGLKSRPCDAEGLATRPYNLIDDGRLTTWLLDLRSARQLGLPPTGHGVRGTGSPPRASASNVYLQPGSLTPNDLMSDIKDGFYVTELVGQGVNTITGDYSRGAAGFWIENGEIAYPVSECTIAGTLQAIFAGLTPADDLVLRYGTDSPTVRVDGLTVAGQ
ncbi:TldD/PmbA family protein [Roseospira marina]|uniref:TldD/PmbA family protein n=1 Tax=Roseospira marina TaxID=140057 RepID=A0A5M6IHI2_9PROT|nr:TldD/PmbA family protein [Roseospira marina]KAA5607407.1 TldD/PmbA family protein [Roseospira marina]MBB4312420.1 PmbA protein [Roseospira marina]MBB5085564.1 PmbA protein [Roseospira marina]